ncbi:Cro/CI family transcriptional regulator [Acinetobacter baumannii]|nr:Cro/CI family transcriptional regulator [Acinetobacter baumannii]
MHVVMLKKDAVQAFKNNVGVAKAIGITKQAVSLWGEVVPELSALKLLKVKPEIPHLLENEKTA